MRYFGVARIRYKGDLEKARAYVPIARTILGTLMSRNKDIGGVDQSLTRKVLPDGVVIEAGYNFDDAYITITVQPTKGISGDIALRLVLPWEPQGFVLTPVNEQYPEGLGLPSRLNDALGAKLENDHLNYTPAGKFPQVLINRFANNKYLDDLAYMDGLPEGAAGLLPSKNRRNRDKYSEDPDYEGVPIDDDFSADRISWEYGIKAKGAASYVNYTPANEPDELTIDNYYEFEEDTNQLEGGVFSLTYSSEEVKGVTATTVVSTLISDRNSVTEPEESIWFTHRPEEMLYPLAIYEGVFQQTNFLRVAVGANTPFVRPLRGDSSPGYWGAYEIATSTAKYMGHSHYNYRPGLRTAGGRNIMSTGQEPALNFANNTCENAQFRASLAPGNALERGELVVDGWESSPGHLAAIQSVFWEKGSRTFVVRSNGETVFVDGTSLDVGSAGVGVNYETYFNVNSGGNPFWNEFPWYFGDTFGGLEFTQIFQQRETWVPTPEWSTETYAGTVGLYSTPNVRGGNPQTLIRRFSLGSRTYDIPFNTYPYPFPVEEDPDNFPPYDENTDVFMGLIGAHPYEHKGKTYIRCVVVENNLNQLATETFESAFTDFVGTYLEIVVYAFPAALSDTGRMDWRNPKYSEWFEEYREQWLPESGITPILPTHCDFTSDGMKFCMQVYEYGGVQDEYAARVAFAFGDTTNSWAYEAIPKPRAAIRPRTMIYEAPVFMEDGELLLNPSEPRFILEDSQEPVINEVLEARTEKVGSPGTVTIENNSTFPTACNKYERRCVGEYLVFPHYDEDDELQHVRLVVDEYQFDYDLASRNIKYSPNDPEFGHYGWMVHKLIYPDEEEFFIRQRYWDVDPLTRVDYTIPSVWGPGDTVTNIYKTGPIGFQSGFDKPVGAPGDGSGKSFSTIIHNWDVKTKRMVYSKEVYKDAPWKALAVNPDPTKMIYIPPTGSSYYAFRVILADEYLCHNDGYGNTNSVTELWSDIKPLPSEDGVWDFGHYVGSIIPDPDFLYENMPNSTRFFYSTECYNPQAEGHVAFWPEQNSFSAPTNSRFVQGTSIGRVPLGTTFSFTDVHTRLKFNFAPYEIGAMSQVTPSSPTRQLMGVIDRMSWEDYEVSACANNYVTRQPSGYNTARNDLTTYSGQPHNIMPAFSSLTMFQQANALQYKDRWLVRAFFKHYPTFAGSVPDNAVYPWVGGYPTAPIPSDYIPPGEESPDWVLLQANFDIDAAVGMEGVTDVYPLGQL